MFVFARDLAKKNKIVHLLHFREGIIKFLNVLLLSYFNGTLYPSTFCGRKLEQIRKTNCFIL